VQTLRTSFGVCYYLCWSSAIFRRLIPLLQSFANISKATTDQLQNLPGFGQVKVKNIHNAFEKPFRNQATSSLSLLASQSKGTTGVVQTSSATTSRNTVQNREDSPIWDIESPAEHQEPHTAQFSVEPFDIELDL